jgi:hypothetical protein
VAVVVVVVGLGFVAAAAVVTTRGAPSTWPGYAPLSAAETAATVARADEVGAALDEWWAVQIATHSQSWRFLPVGDRLTDGDDGVRCDGEVVVVDDDLVDNAWAALCHEGPVVAFDPATFRGSDVALQVILAHEWGHVGQALDRRLDELWADPDAPYAETELQADCYAGAWAASGMSLADRELAVEELRAIADPPDTPQDDPDGHGTADEREAAFRLGVDRGITACLPDSFDAR